MPTANNRQSTASVNIYSKFIAKSSSGNKLHNNYIKYKHVGQVFYRRKIFLTDLTKKEPIRRERKKLKRQVFRDGISARGGLSRRTVINCSILRTNR